MLRVLHTRPLSLAGVRCITGTAALCSAGSARNFISWAAGSRHQHPQHRIQIGELITMRYEWRRIGAQIRRGYSSGPWRPKPAWPLWLKPALYVAGGVVIASISWPLLRFVLLGGFGYGIYRLIRMALVLRDLRRSAGEFQMLWERLQQMASGSSNGSDSAAAVAPGVLEIMQRSAEDGIRVSYETSLRVQQMIGDSVITADAITLGDAISVEKEEGSSIAQNRVEAVFPLFVDGRGTAVFVQAAGVLGSQSIDYAIRLDTLQVLARQKSGEVVAVSIDPKATSTETTDRKKRRHVEDADYRDL
ncbi:hypothetical protein H4R24_004457 [Coemansia sp. RSA 988]|nr:hypothetical protein H4R24_004457 [Coemansia sp. RSA 988]